MVLKFILDSWWGKRLKQYRLNRDTMYRGYTRFNKCQLKNWEKASVFEWPMVVAAFERQKIWNARNFRKIKINSIWKIFLFLKPYHFQKAYIMHSSESIFDIQAKQFIVVLFCSLNKWITSQNKKNKNKLYFLR